MNCIGRAPGSANISLKVQIFGAKGGTDHGHDAPHGIAWDRTADRQRDGRRDRQWRCLHKGAVILQLG